jgi:hypothetical protein
MGASVKVMRSFDYCHFEVCLSTDEVLDDAAVDELRKRAARLADKAVEQYKQSKDAASMQYKRRQELQDLRREVEKISQLAEGDRTPNQQAKVKLLADRDWEAYISERYDYQDDWEEDDTDA